MEKLKNKRLTAWDGETAYYPHCFNEEACKGSGTSVKCDKCKFSEAVCEKLARYEDAEDKAAEAIKSIREAYKGAEDDLRNIEHEIKINGCMDNGLCEASESFEQGYVNGVEFVCRKLGIDLSEVEVTNYGK